LLLFDDIFWHNPASGISNKSQTGRSKIHLLDYPELLSKVFPERAIGALNDETRAGGTIETPDAQIRHGAKTPVFRIS
jgi:hypothetical protein